MDLDKRKLDEHITREDPRLFPDSELPEAEVKDAPYQEVTWTSQEEAEFYGETLVRLITAGLSLHPYVPSGREVKEADYVGKEKVIIDCYNAALQMRMIIDAKMSAAGEARRESL